MTAANPDVVFYNLDKVKFLIQDASGLEVAYAYEDLVFAEHGAFILQFDKHNPDKFGCWFQKDVEHSTQNELLKSLVATASLNNSEVVFKGVFEMCQKPDSEEIDIQFSPGFRIP